MKGDRVAHVARATRVSYTRAAMNTLSFCFASRFGLGLGLALGILAAGAVGCASTADGRDAPDGPDTTDDSADELSAATLAVSTYYVAQRDLRKCVSPVCGGYFVSRVNKTSTRCADGAYHPTCYVAELDLSVLGASSQQASDVESAIGVDASATRVVLRGTIARKAFGSFGDLGSFTATEAWMAPADATLDGAFYKVSDSGIRCFVAPCSSLREQKLNRSTQRDVTGLDLSAAPGSAADKSEASAAAATTGGVLVSGTNAWHTLHASQYFLRVSEPVATDAGPTSP